MFSRCSSCPTNLDGRPCSNPVPVSGPSQCTYLFLGAGPGETENRTGVCYSGLAGDELNDTYLPLANLHREDVTVSNASLCWDGTDRTPSDKRVLACSRSHLPSLLASVQPSVLVLMGGVTQRLADTRIRLDLHHGLPQWTSILGGVWEGWVWPMFEPALGMRETSRMTQLMEDFRNLGKWMRGEWVPAYLQFDERPKDYGLVRTLDDLSSYIRQRKGGVDSPIAIDTERHGQETWSLQVSHTPDTARMIRTDGTEEARRMLATFNEWARDVCWVVYLHNAPQDLDALERVGVHVHDWAVKDTQQDAYHLCSLPQGLKALVYRLIGAKMDSWEDVVWPASTQAMTEWLGRAITQAALTPEQVIHALKKGKCAVCGHQHSKGPCKHDGCISKEVVYQRVEYKPNAMEGILRHVLRYTVQTEEADEPYDPWKKISGERAEMRVGGLRGKVAREREWREMIREVGEMPILGIGNCELQQAVQYGCADADYTLQAGLRMEEEGKGSRWVVEEEDYDQ